MHVGGGMGWVRMDFEELQSLLLIMAAVQREKVSVAGLATDLETSELCY